uniref:REJ domain-containing protein n=1 Tax=Anisakis simplex TaxID=6269 RepID=A0A0M3JKN0_ANISI
LLYSLSTSLSGNDASASGIGNVDSSSASTASTSMQSSVGMGTAPTYPGLFPSALLLTFRLINEFRLTRPDFRHSVRLSALYYSQRHNRLTDLLASSPAYVTASA